MKIKLLELFSGIGGFAKGLHDAGFEIEKHYFSEIDKHAIANYKYNFKHAEYIGSVTDVRGRDIERPTIITFGSPCQDFSLAGQRKGMEGQRSSLVLHAIRLITECRPDFFVWENVKGTFSSNHGADFWAIIKAFADIGGYRLEWQLLNTSWFLPQNRERIYLVGHLAKAGRDWTGVFPFRESDFGYNENGTERQFWNKNTQKAATLKQRDWKGGTNFIETIARTVRSGGRGSLTEKHNWDVICVAQRGRNTENPSDRTTGIPTEQRLEANTTNTTNTLTSVQKDNLIMISAKLNTSYAKGNSKKGRSCINAGRVPEVGNENQSIRRLTEIECERLQGFTDDWTKFGDYNGVIKQIPKTQRYKMCGNAVTVEVVRQIGIRLLKIAG